MLFKLKVINQAWMAYYQQIYVTIGVSMVQKSVFEGSLTEGNLKKLKKELQSVINPKTDQVAIYRLSQGNMHVKEVIGQVYESNNIL